LEPVSRELTLADGAVDYSTTGDNLSPGMIARLEALRVEIVSGNLAVPRAPTGRLPPPWSVTVTQTATVTFDGTRCRYDGPTDMRPEDVLHVRFTNTSGSAAAFAVFGSGFLMLDVPAGPVSTNEGYGRFPSGTLQAVCGPPSGAPPVVPGPVLQVS
ncbi:MAG TPA: hypothetical protein VK461_10715, partial [Acidimicrobiales bacterium]|nr:hypothetical protein [Acidimicrobiales bacterium]